METAAATQAGRLADRWPAATCRTCITMAVAAASPWCAAQQAPGREPPLRLEVRATEIPRLDAEAAFSGSRLGMALLPRAPSAIGVSLGLGPSGTPTGFSLAPDTQRAALDLGVLWRHTLQTNHQVDVMAWRRLPPPDAYTLAQLQQPTYGARVELNLTPGRSAGLVADRGFLGFQLQGGARVSIKRKDGTPMVYYRTNF